MTHKFQVGQRVQIVEPPTQSGTRLNAAGRALIGRVTFVRRQLTAPSQLLGQPMYELTLVFPGGGRVVFPGGGRAAVPGGGGRVVTSERTLMPVEPAAAAFILTQLDAVRRRGPTEVAALLAEPGPYTITHHFLGRKP